MVHSTLAIVLISLILNAAPMYSLPVAMSPQHKGSDNHVSSVAPVPTVIHAKHISGFGALTPKIQKDTTGKRDGGVKGTIPAYVGSARSAPDVAPRDTAAPQPTPPSGQYPQAVTGPPYMVGGPAQLPPGYNPNVPNSVPPYAPSSIPNAALIASTAPTVPPPAATGIPSGIPSGWTPVTITSPSGTTVYLLPGALATGVPTMGTPDPNALAAAAAATSAPSPNGGYFLCAPPGMAPPSAFAVSSSPVPPVATPQPTAPPKSNGGSSGNGGKKKVSTKIVTVTTTAAPITSTAAPTQTVIVGPRGVIRRDHV